MLLKRTKNGKGNGHLSVNGLKTMIGWFAKTSSLKFQSGKPVPPDAIEEVATAVVDRTQNNIAGTSSAREVFRNLDMLYCTAWKIL